MADLPNDSPKPPADGRWLNITRVMAVTPIVVALAYPFWERSPGLRSGCSEDLSLISTALWLVTPPYFISFVHLLGRSAQRRKKGLAWAVVTGSFWGGISLLVALAYASSESVWEAGIPALSTLLQITLVTSAMKTYYSGNREPGDVAVLFKRVGLFIVYFVIFGSTFVALPDFYSSRRASRAAAAAGALRKINSAEVSYSRMYPKGFSTTLAALGPPPGGTAPNASAAGLIDGDLARGTLFEYTFRYTPGAPDAAGKITTYTLTAASSEPACTNWRRFFTDQTGKIHVTSENRPATADDPALD